MAWSMGCCQEKTHTEKAEKELVFTGVSSNVSKQRVAVNLRDMFSSKPDTEREPVKIRPPSPRAPLQVKESVFGRGRSLSCEPTPKPIIRRRAQSLPSPTERRRRLSQRTGVRFVDSLGMKLEDVKVFKAGEDPFVPEHVLFRLLMSSELAGGKTLEISLPYLKPVFELPGDQFTFLERLCRQQVCLERVVCYELGIIGIAQVLNLTFEKEICVRYSFTDWKTSSETKGFWVSNKHLEEIANKPSCDTFHFHLPVPPFILHPGAILEFAICYKVLGTEFWDNNEGENYKLTCHSFKQTVPKECEDSMIHFI